MKPLTLLVALTAMFTTNENLGAQTTGAKKMLVVFYSHSGNTRTVAGQIARATGADLLEIVPETPYPAAYQSLVDQAKKEVEAGYKPALKTRPENLGQYDVIFVGSPCWWYTIAPPVATLLATNDFAGKTLVPFMTHEGSRMGHSEDDIRRLCPKSTLLKGLPVRGGSVKSAEPQVLKWLNEIGITN